MDDFYNVSLRREDWAKILEILKAERQRQETRIEEIKAMAMNINHDLIMGTGGDDDKERA